MIERGTPSKAQIIAARDAWPAILPMPSDAELAAIVEAVNRAPWPDQCGAEYRSRDMELVSCEREPGHTGAHLSMK